MKRPVRRIKVNRSMAVTFVFPSIRRQSVDRRVEQKGNPLESGGPAVIGTAEPAATAAVDQQSSSQ